jgi:hypothetical protein
LEDLHEALKIGGRARSTPNLIRDGEAPWERLYAKGQERHQKLARVKHLKEQDEQMYLEQHSIHNKSDPSEASTAFSRLYNDGMHRELRREQRRLNNQENEKEQLQSKSVHHADGITCTAEEAAERLYTEGKLRVQRLEMQRKKKEEHEAKKSCKVASAKTVSRRINLLYSDAERRKEQREWMAEEFEKEQVVAQLKESVHSHVRHNPAEELERIFGKRVTELHDRTPAKVPPESEDHMQRVPSEPSRIHSQGHGHSHGCAGHSHGHEHGHGHGQGRRAKPGDMNELMGGAEFMPYGEREVSSALTPRRQPSQKGLRDNSKSPRNAGSARAASGSRAGQRNSAVDGLRPFDQPRAPPLQRSASNPKDPRAKPDGERIMTAMVEDGAQRSLSARLPTRAKGPVRAEFVR